MLKLLKLQVLHDLFVEFQSYKRRLISFQVKNLRSQVSRLAIVSLGDLFVHLTKYMDTVRFFVGI